MSGKSIEQLRQAVIDAAKEYDRNRRDCERTSTDAYGSSRRRKLQSQYYLRLAIQRLEVAEKASEGPND